MSTFRGHVDQDVLGGQDQDDRGRIIDAVGPNSLLMLRPNQSPVKYLPVRTSCRKYWRGQVSFYFDFLSCQYHVVVHLQDVLGDPRTTPAGSMMQ
ncbi:hypothetical protein J6590_016755 [Homalodisca vitripennis]|nr:hypothetical protein J6590_016755 [Homalodisca vitripennis]